MKHLFTMLGCLLLVGLLGGSIYQAHAQEKPRKQNGIGDVLGFVVDAETGQYLEGAKFEAVTPAQFEPIKESSGFTTREGFYQVKASLGITSSRFATERIFELSVASILLGGAKHTDRFINISQLIVKVSKEGYRPFYGPLTIASASLEHNHVWLNPIKLAPSAKSFPSFSGIKYDLGHVERVDLDTVTPEAGKDVHYKVSVIDMPVKPKNIPVLDCSLAGTFTDNTSKGVNSGNSVVYEGKISLKTTELQLFGRTHHAVKSGLQRLLFVFNYPTKETYIREGPLRSLTVLQYVATGVEADRLKEMTEILGRLNALQLKHNSEEDSAEMRQLHDQARKLLNLKEEATIEDKKSFVSLFANGEYQKAWASLSAIEQPLRKRFGDNLIDVMKNAAAIQKTPSDFHARSVCFEARRDLLSRGEESSLNPKLLQAIKDMNFPTMPDPQKPEDQIYAARVLLTQGQDQEALNYLDKLKDDPKFGVRAMLILAQIDFDRKEYETAYVLFERAFNSTNAKEIKGFYPHLNYARLLLKKGEYAKAEEYLARALAHGRFPNSDYSRPASNTIVAGQSYSIYTGPSRSGSIGYAYPEGALVQLALSNFDCLEKPDTDWIRTGVLGRALTELDLTEKALPLLEKAVVQNPDEQYLLASYAMALKKSGEGKRFSEIVKRLQAANPRNPEGLALIKLLQSNNNQ